MLYLNLVYTLYMVCKCMSHIYRKIQGLLLQKKKKKKKKKQKQKQSLIIPITAFCGRVIFYTRECQKQQILYYHETQHQNNL